MVEFDENGGYKTPWENERLLITGNFSYLPHPPVFSKDLYCRHVKTRPYLEKGLGAFSPLFISPFPLAFKSSLLLVKKLCFHNFSLFNSLPTDKF